jgi:hypothetical protein
LFQSDGPQERSFYLFSLGNFNINPRIKDGTTLAQNGSATKAVVPQQRHARINFIDSRVSKLKRGKKRVWFKRANVLVSGFGPHSLLNLFVETWF